MLQAELGCSKGGADVYIGQAIKNRYTLVCQPFADELLPGRKFNRGAAQYKVLPAVTDNPQHPHWDKVLGHCGNDLTLYIKEDDWCRENNIYTGATYLLTWFAFLLRDPFRHLPYIGLFGPEKSGKSSLHESFRFLITGGIVGAKTALTTKSDFNGELENAILCYVEEVDLTREPNARSRMKHWTTAPVLDIRRMRTNQYQVPNLTHWIQCANNVSHFPVWPNESRMTLSFVPLPDTPIKKHILEAQLEAEASHFMKTIHDIILPEPHSRLALPVIETEHKKEQADTVVPLNTFLKEKCILDPKAKIGKSEFRTTFNLWAHEQGYPELSHKNFYPLLNDLTAGVVRPSGKVERGGKSVDAYKGICLA